MKFPTERFASVVKGVGRALEPGSNRRQREFLLNGWTGGTASKKNATPLRHGLPGRFR